MSTTSFSGFNFLRVGHCYSIAHVFIPNFLPVVCVVHAVVPYQY